DLVRLYSGYLRCRKERLRRVTILPQGLIARIEASHPEFAQFCATVRKFAVYFPTPTTDTTKERVVGHEFTHPEPDGNEPSSSLKRQKKRKIVVDQDALNLREIDRRRVQEQEERRRILRARLAASGSLSDGTTRLIINEAKDDDQGFI